MSIAQIVTAYRAKIGKFVDLYLKLERMPIGTYGDAYEEVKDPLRKTDRELVEEFQGYVADALRYRFLRDVGPGFGGIVPMSGSMSPGRGPMIVTRMPSHGKDTDIILSGIGADHWIDASLKLHGTQVKDAEALKRYRKDMIAAYIVLENAACVVSEDWYLTYGQQHSNDVAISVVCNPERTSFSYAGKGRAGCGYASVRHALIAAGELPASALE